MGRLTRDGTAELVSRDQILRRERGQETFVFPVQLTTSRIGNLIRLIHTLAICVTLYTLGLNLALTRGLLYSLTLWMNVTMQASFHRAKVV